MKIIFFLTIIFISAAFLLNAQNVFEPVNNDVYNYLERLSIKGVINYHSEMKPILRKDIASFLIAAEKDSISLTEIDKKELKFYEQEYSDEIDMITVRLSFHFPSSEFLSSNRTGRFRLYSYRDSNFAIYLDPIFGLEAGDKFNSSYSHRWNGASLFGYSGKNWGFSLRFLDNEEIGDNIDTTKLFSFEPGINRTQKGKRSIQYDDIQGKFLIPGTSDLFLLEKII